MGVQLLKIYAHNQVLLTEASAVSLLIEVQAQLLDANVYRLEPGAALHQGHWVKNGLGYTLKLLIPLSSAQIVSVVSSGSIAD